MKPAAYLFYIIFHIFELCSIWARHSTVDVFSQEGVRVLGFCA